MWRDRVGLASRRASESDVGPAVTKIWGGGISTLISGAGALLGDRTERSKHVES